MIRRPTISTRTDTLVPYTTLVRSRGRSGRRRGVAAAVATAQARGDALANPECRRGLVPDQHARGAVATALRAHQFHLRLAHDVRSEEHTSELQSLMRISYAVFSLKKKKKQTQSTNKQLISHK